MTSVEPTIVIAHPSADVYGSDLQLLQTVAGLVEAGWRVEVHVPTNGPLISRLESLGATVQCTSFPVLSKAILRPKAFVRYAIRSVQAFFQVRRVLRRSAPERLLVNTMTLPVWVLGGRLSRVRTLVHSHEAEAALPLLAQRILAAPAGAAHVIIANSHSTQRVMARAIPRLSQRIVVIHNGVPGPPRPVEPLRERSPQDPVLVVCVGRLSPRKGVDLLVAAVQMLRDQGVDIRLHLAGSVFPGYEWFEASLRDQVRQAGLSDRVKFLGYCDPWPVLADADIAVVPSLGESFGNVAAEALLACRPVVASDVLGLAEVIRADDTGLLVAPGDARALAAGMERLIHDPHLARQLAIAGHDDVQARFGVATYRQQMVEVISGG